MSNLILTATPIAAANLSGTGGAQFPFEWSLAVQILAGVAVLLALAANAVNIWKMTRPTPPVGDQIRNAIKAHEAVEEKARSSCQKGQEKDRAFQQKRIENAEGNIDTLEKEVAKLNERTKKF